MKKHLAVFELFVRDSFSEIQRVLCAMVLMEVIAWRVALKSGEIDFGRILIRFPIGFIMSFVLIFITIILCHNGSKGNQNYLILRLSIREEWFFIWQIIYNVLCYLLFWFIQAFVLYGGYQIYAGGVGAELVNHQTLMMICYQSPMYHAFIPLSDYLVLFRNLLLALGMGFACAVYSAYGRYHRKIIVSMMSFLAPILVLTGIGLGFVRSTAILVIGVSAVTILISIAGLRTLVSREEEIE